jgi:small-conductance mechanosensitive channel
MTKHLPQSRVALVALIVCVAAVHAAPPATNTVWREALRTKQREATYVARKIVLISDAIDAKCTGMTGLLTDMQVRFHTLLFLLNAATDNPHEFAALRYELQRLRRQVARQCAFLEDAAGDLEGGITVVDNMADELEMIVAQAHVANQDETVRGMRSRVQQLLTALAAQTNKIAAALQAAQPLRADMDSKLGEVQREGRALLHEMLLAPQYTMVTPLIGRFVALDVREWATAVIHILAERLPLRGHAPAVLLVCIAGLWLPVTGAGWWLLRRSAARLAGVPPAAWRHAHRAVLWSGATLASGGAAWALSYPTQLLFHMLLFYGLFATAAHGAHACRLIYGDSDERMWVRPLLMFWLVLTFGEAVGLTDIMQGLLDVVTAGLCLRAYWHMRRRQYAGWAAWAVPISAVICGVMLLLCLVGYLRLAHLLLWLWLPLVTGLELGAALTGLAHARFVTRIPAHHAGLRIVLTGVGIPLVWLVIIGLELVYVSLLLGDWVLVEAVLMKKVRLFGMHVDVLAVAAILFLFFIVQSLADVLRLFFDRLAAWRKLERNVVPSLHNISTYALWSLYAIILLRLLGVSLSNLAMIASGVSVGIGFGLKDVVSNFVSGMIILLGQILREGDVIEIDGKLANVLTVNVRSTVVRTRDNAIVTIPNATIISEKLINWTRNDPNMRRDIEVGVAYNADVRLVARLMIEAAQDNSHVLRDPAPKVLLADFGNSALVFWLRLWIDDAADRDWIDATVRWDMHRLFAAHGVVIAFPQLDVHVHDPRVREVRG